MTTHTSDQGFYLWYNIETGKLASGNEQDLLRDSNNCQSDQSIKLLCRTSKNMWAIQMFNELTEDEQLTLGIQKESLALQGTWDAIL